MGASFFLKEHGPKGHFTPSTNNIKAYLSRASTTVDAQNIALRDCRVLNEHLGIQRTAILHTQPPSIGNSAHNDGCLWLSIISSKMRNRRIYATAHTLSHINLFADGASVCPSIAILTTPKGEQQLHDRRHSTLSY